MNIKEHFRKMRGILKNHGLKAVILIYLTKIPLFEKLTRFFFGRILIKTKIIGSVMYLDIFDKGLHRKLILKGIREVEHVNQINGNIKPGMIGIELGANIGYFALIEARLVGEKGLIYCIEPEPNNVKLLKKNIAANKLGDRMKVFRYLVGDHNGMEKLYLSEFANVHSLSPSRGKEGFAEVPMVTLDNFIKQNNIPRVDFIRMDIEGYEAIAFKGMEGWFRSGPNLKIFMEFHPMYYQEWGWTFEKLLRYLELFGFKVREISKGREVLRDPTIEEILKMHSDNNGSQAFLEKI